MTVPEHLLPLMRYLAEVHLAEQVHQVRLLGHDHPQAVKARAHLEEARELVRQLGDFERVAA